MTFFELQSGLLNTALSVERLHAAFGKKIDHFIEKLVYLFIVRQAEAYYSRRAKNCLTNSTVSSGRFCRTQMSRPTPTTRSRIWSQAAADEMLCFAKVADGAWCLEQFSNMNEIEKLVLCKIMRTG